MSSKTVTTPKIFRDFLESSRNFFSRHIRAASEKRVELSALIKNAFTKTLSYIERIRPVFGAVAGSRLHEMDKITHMKKGGQAPFAPGQNYDAPNRIISLIRKMRAAMRSTQARTYRFAPVSI
jgi:hypothetical protein